MDTRPSTDLLESTHSFPGVYKIKAIGQNQADFETRLLETVRAELFGASELEHSVRSTQGGRHVAVTLDVIVQSAEQVRGLYAKIRELDGLLYLL